MHTKVFHIIGYLASRYGGPPKFALSLGKAMEKHGFESCWWATATSSEKKELAYLCGKAFLYTARFPCSWNRSPELAIELQKKIETTDILHLHQIWDYPLWKAAKIAHRAGKPYIVTTHGILDQSWRYQSLKKRIYMKLMARFILNNASAIHAMNTHEVNGLNRLGIHTPCVLIPNGIDMDEFQTMPEKETAEKAWPHLKGKKVVLFLSRLSPEKGLDILIQSWKLVDRILPDALLVLAGPDNKGYLSKMRKMVQRFGLQDSVMFSGFVKGDLKKALLNRANMFVLPSFTEGFSTVVLEALSLGKPCIVTTGCNIPEIQEVGAGYVIPTGDKDALYRSLHRMLTLSDTERKEMGDCGKQMVAKQYHMDIITRKIKGVYEHILEHKPLPLGGRGSNPNNG